MSYLYNGFPPQQLSFSRKNKAWRKKCVDFGDNHSIMHHHVARKSWYGMKINYDLLNGILHMEDLKALVNPYGLNASFIPDKIQHYSIINSKLNVLRGEEANRLFDPRVVVTNPSAITLMEEEKNRQVNIALQQLIQDTSQSEEDFQRELDRLNTYFKYQYQDKREVEGNYFLNHYRKELEIDQKFNQGFVDGYAVGEEAYQCDIVGGEPTFEKINLLEMRVLMSGYSNKIEDADMIILEGYRNPGSVIDAYYDVLSAKDIKAIEEGSGSVYSNASDSMDNIDARVGNPLRSLVGLDFLGNHWEAGERVMTPADLFADDNMSTLTPYDMNGNVRVLKVYWKSRRKIKKVKSYDPITGEEEFNFYPETYYCDPDKGEEEQIFWVNEAWEGTKIGADIYVNMRPRPVQYNSMSNPSRCHFGIVGSIYSTNGYEPFSMVDIMKPYAYLYDIINDRLNKTLAKNVGKVIRLDFAKVPKGWDADKWLYYINVNGVAVENSWNEGDVGAATGRLAASLNNASSGVIDASLGNEIQSYISMLEWISNKIGDLSGISRQREGQISNRETVGGVERATLQSSHSTQWLFTYHDSVKKRALECFLETAKIAYKGRKIKFDYIMNDGFKKTIEIDGDDFAECDYGLVVDLGNDVQELNQNLGQLAQAGLQNDKMNFSTLIKIYTTKSVSERMRLIEAYEEQAMMQQQQMQQMQQQQFEQQLQQQAQLEQAKAEREYQMHQEDNETKLLVAEINSQAEAQRFAMMNHDNDEANAIEREKIAENARQFDEKLSLDKKKQADDARLKEKQINVTKQKKSS